MRQRRSNGEATSSPITTVLPTDTLLYALRVMERHRARLLAVVGETGLLLGLLYEAHLMKAWGHNPLLPVASVMALCVRPRRLSPEMYIRGETGPAASHAERASNA